MNPLAAIGYPLLAVALLNLGIGVVLTARSERDPLARHAGALGFINALYCYVMAMAYVRAGEGEPYDLYYRAAWIGWLGMAPMAQIIFLLRGDAGAAERWGRRLYALWGIILVLCLTTDVFEGGAASLIPFVDRLGWLERPARALGALTLFWMLFELYRVQRASVGRRRQQIAYFLLGLAAYGMAGLLLAGVLQIIGNLRFDPGLVSYFSLAWMAFTFYAITRHRLFDIRFVLSRATVAILLTSALVLFQVALVRWLVPLVGEVTAVVIASVMAGAALFATPLVALLERAIEWSLVRRRYDFRQAMTESVRVLASLGSVDDVLEQLLGAIRDTIASTSATLLLRDNDVFRSRQGYGPSPVATELAVTSPLARWLTKNPTPFVREEQELKSEPAQFAALEADLRAAGGEVAVAMCYRGEILGILIVGPKADKDAFFQADLELLETLANEAAIAVTNARLVEDLQQAVRARDDFVSVAGHELRTPLMALRLSIDTAMRMTAEDAPVRPRLQTAERQILRLARLTDELLNVSRITAGRLTLELEEIDLGDLVRDVAARFADEVASSGSPLELDIRDQVIGRWDRLRIEQVVSNLISNALKYGAAQPIDVNVQGTDERARLTVRDRGVGIDASDQDRIFGRFERAVTAQSISGFGLGLWITKQIVDAHGGSIRVESSPGLGAAFTVELPGRT